MLSDKAVKRYLKFGGRKNIGDHSDHREMYGGIAMPETKVSLLAQ